MGRCGCGIPTGEHQQIVHRGWCSFSADGNLVCPTIGPGRFWAYHDGLLTGHKFELSSLAFSVDGKMLASGNKDGTAPVRLVRWFISTLVHWCVTYRSL